MKKLLMLIVTIFLITGCTLVRIDNNIDNVLNLVLKQENDLTNTNSDGFSFYLPRLVKILSNDSYNYQMYSDGTYMYLYVDVINAYYKKEVTFESDSELFYSNSIEFTDKVGYLQITQVDGKYFVELMYNFSKIEAYVEKGKLTDVITNMAYILSTIRYNEDVIENIVIDDILNNKVEAIDIFKPRTNIKNIIEYIGDDEIIDDSEYE